MRDLSHRALISMMVAKTHRVPLKDPVYFSKEREVDGVSYGNHLLFKLVSVCVRNIKHLSMNSTTLATF